MNPYLFPPGLGLLFAISIGVFCVTYPGKPSVPVVVVEQVAAVPVEEAARLRAFQMRDAVLARLQDLRHAQDACWTARVRAGAMTGQEASRAAVRCPEGGDEGW